jgi:Xaa-Pro aminopeptidase
MALCVEPGVHVPGWAGASIEQEIIVAPAGPPEVITPTPTRLW